MCQFEEGFLTTLKYVHYTTNNNKEKTAKEKFKKEE